MKKTLLILILLLTVCLLSSCFPMVPPGETTTGETTATTTTAGEASAPVPPLEDVRAALSEAAPTESHLQIATTYTTPDITLVTDVTLLVLGSDAYYAYRAEYLHTVEEALATGEAVGAREGHLSLDGTTIVAQSGEVDAELIGALETARVRMPDLRAEYFSSHQIAPAGDGFVLNAVVKDIAVSLLFDGSAAGTDMVLEIRLDADLRPTALTVEYRAEDGGTVTYTATYAYHTDIEFP